jgi:hypothetical protein
MPRAIGQDADVDEWREIGSGLADQRVERGNFALARLVELGQVLGGSGRFKLAFHIPNSLSRPARRQSRDR